MKYTNVPGVPNDYVIYTFQKKIVVTLKIDEQRYSLIHKKPNI
jgi:hypothetical protein